VQGNVNRERLAARWIALETLQRTSVTAQAVAQRRSRQQPAAKPVQPLSGAAVAAQVAQEVTLELHRLQRQAVLISGELSTQAVQQAPRICPAVSGLLPMQEHPGQEPAAVGSI